MKRLTLIAVMAVGFGISATSATAATGPTGAQFATLSKKVTSQGKLIAQQAKTITTLRSEIAANFVGDACMTASTGDLFQATWLQDNKLTSLPPYTTASTGAPIGDNDACKAIGVPRTVPDSAIPPTLGVLSALIKWLIG